MIDFCLDEVWGESYVLKFDLPYDDDRLEFLIPEVMLDYKGERFFIHEVEEVDAMTGARVHIEAEAAWMRLADPKKAGSLVITSMSPTTGLRYIFDSLNLDWAIMNLSSGIETFSAEFQDASILDMCWQWAKICGCELRWESTEQKRVWMQTQVGSTLPVSFRYGKNVTEIKRTTIPPSVTILYPYGRDGLTIADRNSGFEYLMDFSYYTSQGLSLSRAQELYRKDYIFQDDSFVDSTSLYNEGVKQLAERSQPIITYEIDLVDLNRLTGVLDADYKVGDTVHVFDEILGVDIEARVTRRLRYPYEPVRDKVEIAYGALQVPDNNVSTVRANTSSQWEMFQSRNTETLRKIRNGSSVLNRLVLSHIDDAEWIVGYKLSAVGVGSGNLTITATNDTDASALWPTQVIPFTNGSKIEWDFTYGEQNIPVGTTAMVIRAQSDTANAGMDIAIDATAFWVLARGTTQQSPSLTNSIRYDYTGAVQSFTVPDDVNTIQIEAHGGAGELIQTDVVAGFHGYGGKVIASFAVAGGDQYDVYVGGKGGVAGAGSGGWPNGGTAVVSNNFGFAGGGSSSVQPHTGGAFIATLPSALIVAGAAGGAGSSDNGPVVSVGPTVRRSSYGGNGSFYGGTASDGESFVGSGGTQAAGGATTGLGTPGSFGTGGPGHNYGATGHSEGGGGGGGYYGGGSGDIEPATVGAGGGSGWLGASGYDLEVQDAENDDNGYIIISWDSVDDII